jgi:hypothetical protein
LELIDPYSPDAERIWAALPTTTFFLSWGWIENWLACLPRDQAPRLAVFREDDGSAAAACFLGSRFAVRKRVIPLRSLHLNTTGVRRLDEIWIEYNNVAGALALKDFVETLPGGWDEINLPGLDDTAFGGVREEDSTRHWRMRITRRVPVFLVDLAGVREGGYLPKLSGQTRSQIRRAQKAAGKLELEVASNEAHAIEIYEELCRLHIAHWRTKGEPGSFADPWFDRFHRRLIARRFAAGDIQLVRVRANGGTLGCLYNFVWNKRVLQYQTGFTPSDDARAKPGFVCHTATIEHCAAAGLDVYDFLAGDMRYKKSLSTAQGWLVWCRVQRPRLRFVVEDQLAMIVEKLRERRAARQAQSS